jgi:photosystem II stability/assembly factor-like uncharacterized protein
MLSLVVALFFSESGIHSGGPATASTAGTQRLRIRPAQGPTVPPPQEFPLSLSVVSYDTVFALVGDDLLVTRSAGKTWTRHSLPRGIVATQVDFVSRSVGWLTGWDGTTVDHPVLYKTVDGGEQWQPQLQWRTSNDGVTLDMISPNDGWAGVASVLYQTTDGGRYWLPVSLSPGEVPIDLDFVNHDHGWIVVREKSRYTTTNARQFRPVLTSRYAIAGLSLRPDGRGYVLLGSLGGVPTFGPLLFTGNDGRRWSVVASDASLAQAHAYGFSTGIDFTGSTGWIGTTNGALGFSPSGLLVTTNDGATWHEIGAKHMWAIAGLAMTSPNRGWILAHGPNQWPFLARTTDGGLHWTVAWPPVAPAAVQFVSPQVGYGVGIPSNAQAIAVTHDGGHRWVTQLASTPQPLTAYAFSSSGELVIRSAYVGPNATPVVNVYRLDKHRRSWQLVSTIDGLTGISLTSLGSGRWAMEVQVNPSRDFVEISVDNGLRWTRIPTAWPAFQPLDVISTTQAWTYLSPPKSLWGNGGRLILESLLSRKVLRTALILPTLPNVTYTHAQVDFLNGRVGWLLITQLVRSHKMMPKPGSHRLVRAAPMMENLLYHTTTGGRHWLVWQLPNTWNYQAPDFVTANVGYLIVNGTLLKTTNAGGTWRLATR